DAQSFGLQTSVPLIAVYTGQSPSASGLDVSRKYGSPSSALVAMMTQAGRHPDALGVAIGAPSGVNANPICACSSSLAETRGMRSVGLAASTESGSHSVRKSRYRRGIRSF